MRGLLIKDGYLILKNLSMIYLAAFLMAILPGFRNPSMLLPLLSMLVAVVLGSQVAVTLSWDEKAKWKTMLVSFPLSVFQEVAGKYVLSLILSIISFIAVCLLGGLARRANIIMDQSIILFAGLSFCVCLLYNMIMIPATYLFGSGKSRMVLIIFVGVLPTVAALLLRTLRIDITRISFDRRFLAVMLFSGMIILLTISFFISYMKQKVR